MKYLSILLVLVACNAQQSTTTASQPTASADAAMTATMPMTKDTLIPPQYDKDGKLIRLEKTNAQWKKELSAGEYTVMREQGTERAFTGDLVDNHQKGTFVCAACGLPLFSSEAKFESGTGWPSFFQPMTKDCIAQIDDTSHGMTRQEVECARCGAHQGHVFDDGPEPTGLRYCINSAALNFVKQ